MPGFRRVISIIQGGGTPGGPTYTAFRFRTSNTYNWGTGDLLTCIGVSGEDVSWNHTDVLGTNGYVSVGGNDYTVIKALRVHPTYPDDTPAATQGIKQGSQHADATPFGDTSPHFDLGNQDTDATVDFEACHNDGTRDDDP